jgi:hypothetical protein
MTIINFAMRFSYVKNELNKTRLKIKEMTDKKFQKHLFKKMDFKDEKTDADEIINQFKEVCKLELTEMKKPTITGGVYVKLEGVQKLAEEISGRL